MLAHEVQVAPKQARGITLPDGRVYQPGDYAFLSDADYAKVGTLISRGILLDDGVVSDPTTYVTEGEITGILTSANSSTTAVSPANPGPIGSSLFNLYTITALALPATFLAPSGTPKDGNVVMIRVKDDGTARSLSWNAAYTPVGVHLPSATQPGRVLYVGSIYNAEDSTWDVVAIGQK